MSEPLRTVILFWVFATIGFAPGACRRDPCYANPMRPECVISDTTEDIWPDPVDRTRVHLNYLVRSVGEHVERTGQLPASLNELFPGSSRVEPGRFRLDAWQREVIYTVLGGGRFELRSGGADGRPGTVDDVVVASDPDEPAN